MSVGPTFQSLYPQRRNPLVTIEQEAGGPGAGLDDMEKWKFMTPPGIELRALSRPAS
jgi:hypothetical protein